MKKIIVFGSGEGTNFQAIADAIRREGAPIEVLFVFSDDPHAPILSRAERFGIPTRAIDYGSCRDEKEYNARVLELLVEAEPWDLLVLAGYMRILPPEIVRRYAGKIVNIHPSLLPAFRGLRAVERALEAGVKVTGVTVHLVDEGVDTGPILAQEAVPVLPGDTPETLRERIHAVEHRLYFQVIKRLLFGEAPPRRRALFALHDRTGAVDFARGLLQLGWEIVATPGTARTLREAGVPAIPVEALTGYPELLGGRVKTLHPALFAGLLAKRDDPAHLGDLSRFGLAPIGLLCVNFYPFAEVARRGASDGELLEEIDIGGPALVRAAAKNLAIVLVDPADYGPVLEELRSGDVGEGTRKRLALKAFSVVAELDAAIHRALASRWGDFPADQLHLSFLRAEALRLGENRHQRAWVYAPAEGTALAPPLWEALELLWGKPLSYNNLLDLEAAARLAAELPPPAAVIVKHAAPCGAAVGASPLEAYRAALACDPVSAFGGIVAVNGIVDAELAWALNEHFLELVVAPGFTPEALEVLKAKKNRRIVRLPLERLRGPALELRSLGGDLLLQERDAAILTSEGETALAEASVDGGTKRDLLFAFAVCKYVKSNAIVVAKGGRTLGIGGGQPSRVRAAEIALKAAGERAQGAVMASDGFFPFPDAVELAAAAGIKAIIQPGGSVRDREVLEAAARHGIAMVLVGIRHFRH